jgi:MoaA/NifB/PqqE/SkfB family radical SAM enzyme
MFRAVGWPRKLPMNLTVSVTNRCNSRCKTCNIHKKQNTDELTIDEWERIAKSVGKDVFWITFSGGEPFLRNDLVDLVCLFNNQCRPSIINIPTNGLMTELITDAVERIAVFCGKARVVVNVSIDEIGERHDEIRGVSGCYERAVKTFGKLKDLKLSNLSVGIHTLISRFNVDNFQEIHWEIMGLHPDSYVTEIAEEREELGTIGANITPEYNEYADATDFLIGKMRVNNSNSMGAITRAFHPEYYEMVKRMLRDQRQIIPCYAGFASAQISAEGEAWMCCTKAESMGNLREDGYDFRKVWLSEKAENAREKIKRGDCWCPLANAAYTNMLMNTKFLSKVAYNYLVKS